MQTRDHSASHAAMKSSDVAEACCVSISRMAVNVAILAVVIQSLVSGCGLSSKLKPRPVLVLGPRDAQIAYGGGEFTRAHRLFHEYLDTDPSQEQKAWTRYWLAGCERALSRPKAAAENYALCLAAMPAKRLAACEDANSNPGSISACKALLQSARQRDH